MNHGANFGKTDGSRPCWTCEHFVAITEGGSAFCVHGGDLRACSQASGCAFHRKAANAPGARPEPISFCAAWRRVPKNIPRPPEVMQMLIEDRRGQRSGSVPSAGWRDGSEHQWSRDPGRGRRYE
jgi:hypothetical protein